MSDANTTIRELRELIRRFVVALTALDGHFLFLLLSVVAIGRCGVSGDDRRFTFARGALRSLVRFRCGDALGGLDFELRQRR